MLDDTMSTEERAAETTSECCPIAPTLTKRLTASAAFSIQPQFSSRSVRSSRKNRTRCSQAQTPPIRSKSPKKLCVLAGEKNADIVAAARKATSDQKIGSS